MGLDIFVNRRDRVRIHLADCDIEDPEVAEALAPHWIDVRKQLSQGERQDLSSNLYRGFNAEEGTHQINFRGQFVRYLSAWLLGWSFTDENGRPVAQPDTDNGHAFIASFEPRVGREIERIVKEHDARTQEAGALAINPKQERPGSHSPTEGAGSSTPEAQSYTEDSPAGTA